MPPLHKLAGVLIVLAVIVGLVAPDAGPERDAAATSRDGPAPGDGARAGGATPGRTPTGGRSGGPGPSASPSASPVPTIGAASAVARQVRAYELGQIPVIMYHRIAADGAASLDRTPDELRDELTRLAEEGYAPITAAEFARGRIDVPAGRHPVVLTFDDGTPGHFALDERGVPRPDTAVGVLLDVARRHPGFRPVATFYVNDDPFRLGDRAADGLRWLLRNGFEIGNHTLTHADLSRLSKDEVQKEIAEDEERILALTGTHTTTLAYPFGSVPRRSSWARSKEGAYAFQGIFLAGWRPSVSPFHRDFDPESIMRIRSEGKIKENDCRRFCSQAWLEWLRDHPEERYVSDGDPGTVAFPEARGEGLADRYRGLGRVY
ncbi:polysaccharide deacetylase family protein [Thermomonospora umbrina]|uniref:Polysaccharide deacetylase n=1 Tax=Thermomonospora umbrina TaxID=111806 RepID=A0A3D9T7M9_9ACTN|nr:polysaccharide deacetylase family protein [Thermomonospora umbrina]REE99781.1 polysaccharide deacetylase [Thermomonospora umbrina]